MPAESRKKHIAIAIDQGVVRLFMVFYSFDFESFWLRKQILHKNH
jgi:hypothetical protein